MLGQYDAPLIYACCCYDRQASKRYNPVETVAEESGLHSQNADVAAKAIMECGSLTLKELDLQQHVKRASGIWNDTSHFRMEAI